MDMIERICQAIAISDGNQAISRLSNSSQLVTRDSAVALQVPALTLMLVKVIMMTVMEMTRASAAQSWMLLWISA